ncbi:dipeptidyl peptidase 4 [Lepisosteus oculatus]|uniref:Fibroblast activation protein, alpha n=1 Tax=Lepisosteus oculatus TaxID=7918 RepID=W5MPM3_LEPOC|nr:PREDICTED: dipeptidyl peptidase 4-like [Lepisosteus oculatus]
MKTCQVFLGLAVAAVVITLIAVPAAMLLGRNDLKENDSQKTFSLDDYFNDTIRYKSYNLRWISDTEYLHKRGGNVFRYDVETNYVSEFLSNNTFAQVDASDYLLSDDQKYVLFESNYTKLWRHSYTASYSIFDVDKSTFVTSSQLPHKIQYIEWAPTGNKLAYVWKNNVYLKTDVNAAPEAVTTNGEENKIFNGIPDWVYEEEMFAYNYALWWSPSGKFLAYAQFNDTEVNTIEYSFYGDGQYPETVIFPYPKAGSTIPIAKLFVVDTSNISRIAEVIVPDPMRSSDHYLSTITWVTDNRIAVQWLFRAQNHSILVVYDYSTAGWNHLKSYEEKSQTGWVGQFYPLEPFFAADNISFYKIMSDKDGYKHIHYVNSSDNSVPITSGKWEVIYISKLTKDTIYYVSNQHEGRPGQRNLYRIKIGSTHSNPECLTCKQDEKRCQYNSAYFSKNAKYYRMDCYGPGLPKFTLHNSSGKEIKVLEENKDLENILAEFQMPTIRRETISLGEFHLWYQMTLPPNFDESKKYPLLIDVYAGPCSQKVDFRFRLNWATYLASTEKIIVASFDGRGSGYQGDKIMHSIYRRLGTYEVEDQITAVRKFIDMGFIDKTRIAIWGWSYGGYVTSMALGAGSGVFKCGIAVAPVSKWEYYDAIYTERYMGQPTESDNLKFYQNSTVTGRAKNFKSINYLLVHGTADDNVHFQQAAQISKALVDEQVDFEAMWYTDKDHGLGGSAYHHVYTHISHFLRKCFSIN